MEIIRALKMRIYPNDEQKVKIDKTLGACRFVYNHMLARNRKVYERQKEHLSFLFSYFSTSNCGCLSFLRPQTSCRRNAHKGYFRLQRLNLAVLD